MKKIAFMLFTNCFLCEIIEAINILSDYSDIDYIGIDNGELITSGEYIKIIPNKHISNSNFDDYIAVVLPGGNIETILHNKLIDNFLMNCYQKNILIAGICNGAWIMAKSNILNNHKCTHTAHESCNASKEIIDEAKPYFKDTIYSFDNIVIDKYLINAKPWAKIQFAFQIGLTLGFYNTEKSQKYIEYYKGNKKAT